MLESLYYVLTWACNRRCAHCYDERFRPYAPAELEAMLPQQEATLRSVVANLPERFGVVAMGEDGVELSLRSRIILSGGELLLPQVFERLLLPALELLRDRYPSEELELVLQTGGDLLDEARLDSLLERDLGTVSVSSMDAFHAPLDGAPLAERQRRLEELFRSRGMQPSHVVAGSHSHTSGRPERCYSFFGATPEMWIGRLWPGGRAWQNSLSTATMEDNFCAAWSGARGFLDLGQAGSEVAIDPEGRLYPCCRKTAAPYADLTLEPLQGALQRLAAQPPLQALADGDPRSMAACFGVDAAAFDALCEARTPDGHAFANPCLGCDAIHRRFLAKALDMPLEDRTPGRTP